MSPSIVSSSIVSTPTVSSAPLRLSPLQHNENPTPLVPLLLCGDRVWKAAELIYALRRGSGVARDAIYMMTTRCVTHWATHDLTHDLTQGQPARTDCRDEIEEVTACVLAAIHGGALQRAEFLPNFIEIVARMFLRQQSPVEGDGEGDDQDEKDGAAFTIPVLRQRAPVVSRPRNPRALPRAGSRAGRQAIRSKS